MRLESIQYTAEKIIAVEVNQGALGLLFGDRLLLVAHGYVIAGVDLSDLSTENLQLDNGVLRVDSPEPEVFIATINNAKLSIYNRAIRFS